MPNTLKFFEYPILFIFLTFFVIRKLSGQYKNVKCLRFGRIVTEGVILIRQHRYVELFSSI